MNENGNKQNNSSPESHIRFDIPVPLNGEMVFIAVRKTEHGFLIARTSASNELFDLYPDEKVGPIILGDIRRIIRGPQTN